MTPLILNIETSASICSVALSRGETVIDYLESPGERSHASHLTPFIDQILKKSGVVPSDLDVIAVSKGPGSYTGLRIGVSTAKGIAYSLNKPLIGVDTLLCMCLGLKSEHPDLPEENVLLCPMIDARRMEVYLALYKNDLTNYEKVRAEIITKDSFLHLLKDHKILFFGDGMEKCREILRHENSVFIENVNPLARFLASVSYTYYKNNKFENLAYFEPFYLKDFVATTPRNLLEERRK